MIRQHRQKSSHKTSSRGFTLIELIVTVGILAFGIVTIYEAFFVSVDTYGFYVNYLETQDWIDEKIAQKNDELTRALTLEIGAISGQVVRNQKTFHWTVVVSPVNVEYGLYKVDVTLSWNQGSKRVHASRVAYLLPPQLKAYEEIFV